jgi:protocatechuate 3,4-dioxygenase beta subunit
VPTEWASVRGRVLDAAGEPLRLQRLQLEDEQANSIPRWSPFAWAWTDVAGNFAFDRQQPRASVRVTFSGFGGAGETEPFALDGGAGRNALELRAVAAASVEGVARDDAGTPVSGARVWLRTWDRARGQQRDGSVTEVVTDRAGRYRHAGLAPGDYFLQLFVDGDKEVARTDPFELRRGQRRRLDL